MNMLATLLLDVRSKTVNRARDLKESAEMHRNIYSAIRRRDVAAATQRCAITYCLRRRLKPTRKPRASGFHSGWQNGTQPVLPHPHLSGYNRPGMPHYSISNRHDVRCLSFTSGLTKPYSTSDSASTLQTIAGIGWARSEKTQRVANVSLLALRAANDIEPFRYRLRDGKVR